MTAYPDSIRGIDPVADSGHAAGPSMDAETADLTDRLADATLLVVAPARIGRAVSEAFAADPITVRYVDRGGPPDDRIGRATVSAALDDHDPVDGVLVVVPRGTDVARVPGPLVDGVPVGVVRADRPVDLDAWCSAAVTPRRHAPTWAVLSMGKDAFLDPAGRLHRQLAPVGTDGTSAITTRDWRAERVDRPELCGRLATGPTLAVYLGHGHHRGWSGYQALRWHHVAAVPQRTPVGVVLSLTCDGLSTRGSTTNASFLERFVREGRAGAVLGSVGDVRIDAIETVADRLGTVLCEQRPATLGGLLRVLVDGPAADVIGEHLSAYRIVGLPIQPIR